MKTTTAYRRHLRTFLPAMAVYVVVLLLSFYALRAVDAVWGRAMLAMLPLVPIGYAARSLLRFVRDSDELQRRIQLEAFALASLVLTLGTFSLGLLAMSGVVRLDAGLSMVMVLPAYALLYGLFAAITACRYQ